MTDTRFFPRNIRWDCQDDIDKVVKRLGFADSGVRAFVVDGSRGRAYREHNTITVPYWAWREEYVYKKRGRFVQYVAHEIAHLVALDQPKDGNINWETHGEDFQECMKAICPKSYWHWESEYVPSRAAAAGIKRRRNG